MKRYLIIISILIIAASALLFYLYQNAKKTSFEDSSVLENTEVNNSNLVTYKSNNFGYLFDYKNIFTISNYNQEKNIYLSLENKNSLLSKEFDISVTLYSEYQESLSIKDLWIKYGPQNDKNEPYPDEEKEIKIGDSDAYYTSYETSKTSFGNDYFTPVFIYIAHKGSIFQISGVKVPENIKELGLSDSEIQEAKEYETLFNEMVQSFRFTE